MLEYWETLSTEGDIAVNDIAIGLKDGTIDLDTAFSKLVSIDRCQDEFVDAEISKETVCKFFDFIEKNTDFNMDDVENMYQKHFYDDLEDEDDSYKISEHETLGELVADLRNKCGGVVNFVSLLEALDKETDPDIEKTLKKYLVQQEEVLKKVTPVLVKILDEFSKYDLEIKQN